MKLNIPFKKHSSEMYFSKIQVLFFAIIVISILGTIAFPRFANKTTLPTPEEIPRYLTQTITIPTPFDPELIIQEPLFPDRICSIADFGGESDGKTMNTEAFRMAIESCSDAGGGKVIVPPGIWLTGPIRLKSNIELRVERDATILFSTRLADYLPVVFSRFEGIEYYNYAPPIYARDASNIAITGAGTINGQGDVNWWKIFTKATPKSINRLYAMGDNDVPVEERIFGSEAQGLRPSFIQCINCHNVLIEDVRLINGPMWTIHPVYSDNIIIRGVDIATAPGPSTDGIVIDSSSHVLIENSSLSTGDDAIVLKSGRDKEGMRIGKPTENIVIRNCTVRESHGAVAIGSEMSGDVRNVLASDIAIEKSQYGFRIKATQGRGGIVENIWAENFAMKNISIEAVQITTAYGASFGVSAADPPIFRNIHLKSISAKKTPRGINIDGLPEQPIYDISLEDISIAAAKSGMEIQDTSDIRIKNARLTLKYDNPLFTVKRSDRISIQNSPCQENIPLCLLIEGEDSDIIDIRESGFERKRVKTSSEVSPAALLSPESL